MQSNTKLMASSAGFMWLGFLTLIITAFIYARVQKTRKEKETEREAYLKRKGELEAEKEELLPK